MKLIGYVRVSTIGQAKDGLGLPTQERMIRAWAKTSKHRLVKMIRENGKSGTLDETERPGLLEALTALRSREADALVVTSIDRLARALHVQEGVLGKAWALGGKVFTVDGGEVAQDDPDDPMRKAMRQMAGVFAELDKNMIAKRLRNGRKTKALAGGYAYGSPPYGWRAPVTAEERKRGKLVPVDDEQKAITLARQLHRKGASLREIADTLLERGYKPRSGKTWHPPGIRNILNRK